MFYKNFITIYHLLKFLVAESAVAIFRHTTIKVAKVIFFRRQKADARELTPGS